MAKDEHWSTALFILIFVLVRNVIRCQTKMQISSVTFEAPLNYANTSQIGVSLLPNQMDYLALSTERRTDILQKITKSERHNTKNILLELISFIINKSDGRETYVIIDSFQQGAGEVIGLNYNSWIDTTILTCEHHDLLEVVIKRSNDYRSGMRNVIVLCQSRETIKIFEQVAEDALESTTVTWFVVSQDDIERQLRQVLREGTRVCLINRYNETRYKLTLSMVEPSGVISFESAGWVWIGEDGKSNSYLSQSLTKNLEAIYSDFERRHLTVSANNNWPFFGLTEFLNGTTIPDSGIDVNILNTLSDTLNFTQLPTRISMPGNSTLVTHRILALHDMTRHLYDRTEEANIRLLPKELIPCRNLINLRYHVEIPPDRAWGGPQSDGSVTGLIGVVSRHESHFAICEITITDKRETVVDFTTSYWLESLTLVSRAPEERDRTMAVFLPFSSLVWILTIVVTLLIGPVVFIVNWFLVTFCDLKVKYDVSSCSFNMFRSMTIQGNLLLTTRWPLRFIFIFWYLFCYNIYAMYSGTLTAYLAIPAFEPPIDALTDLPKAAKDGFTIGTLKASSTEHLFKYADSGIYKEVWNLFDLTESLLPTPDEGFDKALEEKFVLINSEMNGEIRATVRGRDNYHFGRDTFYPHAYGIACNSGAPFKNNFDKLISWITEAGLVRRWAQEQIEKLKSKGSQFQGGSEERSYALTLNHLQAAFFLLFGGMILSFASLVAESLTSHLILFH